MLLYDIFSSPQSSVAQALEKFRVLIERGEIWRPADDVQFVFLCGANIKPDVPSKRRQFLMDFSSKHLPNTKFFLAETIFKLLEAEGHTSNILDIENELSRFADHIIIVLESESTFCELGAFATHSGLRKKLIIINDSAHRLSKSFINLGPVQAVREISGVNHVLDYKMNHDGREYGDGIGEIFENLYTLLYRKPTIRRTKISDYDPNHFFTKDSLRFIHDLVYFSNPISFPELSRLIKLLFGKSKDSNLRKHLGLLCAIEQTERSERGLYKSMYNRPFFEYETYDVNNIVVAFRNLYLRNDHNRFS